MTQMTQMAQMAQMHADGADARRCTQMHADIGYKTRFDLFKVIHQIVPRISAAIRMELPSISA